MPKKTKKREPQVKPTTGAITASKQEVKSIRIPLHIAKYAAGVLGVFILLMAGTVIHYQNMIHTLNTDKNELEFLRKNNAAQVAKIEELTKVTAGLQADMERLNSLDAELRKIANHDDTTTASRAGLMRPALGQGGQGGPLPAIDVNNMESVLQSLQVSMKEREESLNGLKDDLLEKQARLSARPSIWPTNGEVTSRFGWRNSPGGYGSDYHPGIDIATSTGTPVLATADGVVTMSGWESGYGKTVKINHGHGISTLYGHNSQLAVQGGDKVKKGQLIAYVGSTGYSTGPHVHYEVQVNGTAVNPANFLN